MKKLFVLFAGIILLFGCRTENSNNAESHTNHQTEEKLNDLIAVDYASGSGQVKAGEPAELSFEVKKPSGEIIREMDVVHEKPMHLLIVSEDLKEFFHVHPEQNSEGVFKTTFTFPHGGYYRLYADLTPKGNKQIVKDFTQTVVGEERPKEPLAADQKFEKTIDGLRVVMTPDAPLENGKEVMLNFQAYDAANGRPVADLEKYLGEYAHFVIIGEDLRDFVHAHPVSRDTVKSTDHAHTDGHNDKLMSSAAESIVSAHVTFPNAQKYKIWAQFQRAGKIFTVPFVVEIGQGKAEKTLSEVKIPDGAFKIVVSKDGFTPQEINYRKGQPLTLAFVRIDEENCGSEIVFKDLNIKKSLPVGEVVTVDVPTETQGEINFSCGMDMLRGKIIIQ